MPKYIKNIISALVAFLFLLSAFSAAAESILPPISIDTSPVINIELYKKPKKLTYFIGEDIDVTGAQLKITHENGTTEIVDVVRNWCGEETQFPKGESTVYIEYPQRGKYDGASPSFKVTFSEPSVSKIVLTKIPIKTSYYAGEELEIYGLEAVAYFTTGESVIVTSEVTCTGYNKDKTGKQTITVSYVNNGKKVSATFSVNVTALNVKSCFISTPPDRVSYYEGENIDLKGIVVGVKYNDGRTEMVDDLNEITAEDYDPSKIGVQLVKISCMGVSTELEITNQKSPTHVHSAGVFQIIEEPTCTKDGFESATCVICKEIAENRTIDALGHKFGEWTIIKEPTLYEEGERSHTCLVCSEAISENILKLQRAISDDGIVVSQPNLSGAGTVPFDGTISVKMEVTSGSMMAARASDFGSFGIWTDKFGYQYNLVLREIIDVTFYDGDEKTTLSGGIQCSVSIGSDTTNVCSVRIPGYDEFLGSYNNNRIIFELNDETKSGFSAAIIEYVPYVEKTNPVQPETKVNVTEKIGVILLWTAIGTGVIVVSALVTVLILKKKNSDMLR